MITVKKLTKLYKTPDKTGNIFRDFFARRYKSTLALDNISFSIENSELVGFVGPNGAGKTTTMKILSGILYPTSGQVEVLGFEPFAKKKEFLRQIAFIMGQKNQLLWDLPVEDSFLLNKEIYEVDDTDYKKHLSELVELLDCEKFLSQPAKTLSLGQRMRAELVNALLHKPKVMFLDEPTIGLDIFGQTTIINFIKEYQKRHQSTIILTSHNMKDIQKLAKRIILIDKGKIIFDGKLEELIQKFSQQKLLKVILKKPLNKQTLSRLAGEYEYQYPLLRLKLNKDNLLKDLQVVLTGLEFSDLTLEDEPIEEIIKKVFLSLD